MPKYRLSKEAENDLIRIYRYGVKQFGQSQADKYFDKLSDCFRRIANTPYACAAVDDIVPGYRRCVCGVDSIYYRIDKEYVVIVTIIGRQEMNTFLEDE